MKTFAGRKLGRKPGHRSMLLRNLTESLLMNEKLETTVPKAKELARYAQKIITMAKHGGEAPLKMEGAATAGSSAKYVNAQRQVARYLAQADTRKKLFAVLVPRYLARNGGYTQIVRSGQRKGDAAPMAVIRLVP